MDVEYLMYPARRTMESWLPETTPGSSRATLNSSKDHPFSKGIHRDLNRIE